VAACLTFGGGCGGGKPPAESSLTEATVKGTVTVHGKPATSGKVIFDPTNINRRDASLRVADIRPDGTYQATTLIGPNSVTLTLPRTGTWTDAMSPDLAINVRRGENSFDISLPWTGYK
jgi:hypothetical protein